MVDSSISINNTRNIITEKSWKVYVWVPFYENYKLSKYNHAQSFVPPVLILSFMENLNQSYAIFVGLYYIALALADAFIHRDLQQWKYNQVSVT